MSGVLVPVSDVLVSASGVVSEELALVARVQERALMAQVQERVPEQAMLRA